MRRNIKNWGDYIFSFNKKGILAIYKLSSYSPLIISIVV